MLKVKRRTVLRWIQQGKLPGIRLKEGIASQWRVDRDDLDEYLKTLKGKWTSQSEF